MLNRWQLECVQFLLSCSCFQYLLINNINNKVLPAVVTKIICLMIRVMVRVNSFRDSFSGITTHTALLNVNDSQKNKHLKCPNLLLWAVVEGMCYQVTQFNYASRLILPFKINVNSVPNIYFMFSCSVCDLYV